MFEDKTRIYVYNESVMPILVKTATKQYDNAEWARFKNNSHAKN